MFFDTMGTFMGGTVRGNRLRATALLFPLLLAAGGCMVTSSRYEMKTREADTLRDALAAANKEKTVLDARAEALQAQLAAEKEEAASLSSRVRTREEEARKLNEELASARKNYEGTRITREQFISELLEKEKATGKRIQEMNAKTQSCEQALEALKKESAARNAELAELRKKTEKPQEEEAIRRERDILLGRVERLTEERKIEEKRRETRFAALKESIEKISPGVKVTPLGPSLDIYLPVNVLFSKGKAGLSDGCRKVLAEAGKAAAEFAGSSFLVSTGAKKTGEDIRAALEGTAKITADRILLKLIEKEKGAELLLLVP
ncbi:MAG: hypothetical protein HY896_06940 [Deltaproteobacteria bacterium]|nr:hypothetical protein [Deltaproteobacteria bacterium]